MDLDYVVQDCDMCGRFATLARQETRTIRVQVPEGTIDSVRGHGGLTLNDSVTICLDCAKPEQWDAFERKAQEKMLRAFREARDAGLLPWSLPQ